MEHLYCEAEGYAVVLENGREALFAELAAVLARMWETRQKVKPQGNCENAPGVVK